MSQIQQPPCSSVPWEGRNFYTKKKIENRGCSYFVAPENGYLVFNIQLSPNEAIANQSEKVGMSQIQQQPLK